MAKLSRCRGALGARALQTPARERAKTGAEREIEGWRLVVSLFATPVSPKQ